MPLRPIAIIIALLALGGAAWLLIAAARQRRRWLGLLLRVTPAVLLLALVASLVPYIVGLTGPRPFFNRAAPVPASTIVYSLVYSDPRAQHQTVQTATLAAILGQTGKLLWQRAMPGGATTVTDGGDTVYTVSRVSGDSQLLALSAATGAIRWQKTLPNAFADQPPVLAQGVLFLGAPRLDKQLLAFRPSDGFLLWSIPIGASPDDPIALSATADTLFVTFGLPNAAFVQARRITDGQLLWSDSPLDGTLVLGSAAVYELPTYGSLVARDTHTGAKLWQFGDHDVFHSGVVSGDTLFVSMRHSGPLGDANGHFTNLEKLYALDTASGRLRWTFATQSGNAGTVAASHDTIYVRADDGIHALRASDGALRWHSDPHNNWTFDGFSARPAVVNHTLYVTGVQTLPPETLSLFAPQRGQDYLYAVNEADGSADWAIMLGPVVTIYPHFLS